MSVVSNPGGGNVMADLERNSSFDRIERENQRLRAAVEELSVLNDIATAVSSTSSLEHIIELIVHKCIKHLKVEQATITLLSNAETETPFRTIIRGADTSHQMVPFRLDAELTGWMLKNQKPLLVNDLKSDSRFQFKDRSDYPIRSILSVPLVLKGRMIGLLNLFNKRTDGGFTEADQRLLGIIASQSAQTIENARLYTEEQNLKLMQEEMRLAYDIQMNLLPKEPPKIGGYDIAGMSIPAKAVGGDYFDFLSLSGDRLGFCLGDVSGKGMPAALLMANLQATLRGQINICTSPRECLERSNTLLFKSTDADKFATLFCGVLDYRNHRLTYSNAGHNYPFLFTSAAEPKRLSVGGVVLGCLEEFAYKEESLPVSHRDVLLIFSDGISESTNAADEEFGEERIARILLNNRERTATQIIDAIVHEARHYSGDAPQRDDMTLLVIKRVA
jgi:sigma-B regulation protein RsbU (phosphoserine phosphatase)